MASSVPHVAGGGGLVSKTSCDFIYLFFFFGVTGNFASELKMKQVKG